MSGCSRAEFHHAHHAAFGMVEDVAMEHPHPGPVVVPHDESHGFVDWRVERVLPGKWAYGLTILVEYLKEKTVQVDRMRPLRVIRDRPDLRLSDACFERFQFRRTHIVDAILDRLLVDLNEGDFDFHGSCAS